MSGLRVAICFGTYPPLRNGGADFVRRFAAALRDRGCAVHVLTSSVESQPDVEGDEGVAVHRVVDDWRLFGGSVRRARGLIRSERIDVVHVLFPDSVEQERYQLPVALGTGRTPLVTTFWNLGIGRRSPMRIRAEAVALLARSGALSSHEPAYLRVLSRVAAGRPTGWIPVGNNVGRAPRGVLKDDVFEIVYFGQLDPTRGVEDLFEAVRLLRASRHVRLTMLGSAGRPERYESRAALDRYLELPQRLGIDDVVEWTPYLPDDETAARLASVDLCVLPYRRNSIGRSALAAALDNGVPVVLAGTAPGIAPLRDGEHVALVPPRDPAALAARIVELIDDRDRLAALERGALTAAAWFAWPAVADAAAELYVRALR